MQKYFDTTNFGCFLVFIFTIFNLQLASKAATFTVNTTLDTVDAVPGNGVCADSLGNCSLRAAIGETNQLAISVATRINTITLPAGVYTLTIMGSPNEQNNASGDLNLRNSSNLTINGANARTTIIQAGTEKSTNGTDGDGIDRIFRSFGTAVILTLNNLTIRHGKAPDGVGFSNSGGAIEYNAGLSTGGGLNINSCAIIDNASTDSGGGIFTNTNTNITNSLIAKNVAFTFNYGGGIFGGNSSNAPSTLNLTNTTISSNSINTASFGGNGGGISFDGDVNITNCTITNNTAIGSNGRGGGIAKLGTSFIRLRNTIVAENFATAFGNDLANAANNSLVSIVSGGTNLIGDATSSNGWDTSDLLNNLSANLGILSYYGGETDLHSISNGSSALNAGQNCVVDSTCPIFNAPMNVTTDQRGLNRLVNGFNSPNALFVDIGSFELQNPTAANISISGKVFNPFGRGLLNAIVMLTDKNGQTKTTRTSSFGYFNFDDVESGKTYVLSVNSKLYHYQPQILSVIDEITELNLYPLKFEIKKSGRN